MKTAFGSVKEQLTLSCRRTAQEYPATFQLRALLSDIDSVLLKPIPTRLGSRLGLLQQLRRRSVEMDYGHRVRRASRKSR